MSAAFLALLAFGLLPLFALAVAASLRWPQGVLYVVGGFALAAWEFPSIPTLFNLGSLQVKPEDVVVSVAMCSVAMRPAKLLGLTRAYTPIMLLIVVSVAASLANGVAQFGPAALNEFRGFMWPIGLTAWMLNQDWTGDLWLTSFYRWSRVMGLFLSAILVVHAAFYGFGSANSFVLNSSGVEQTGRPLVSSQALMLATAGFLEFRAKKYQGNIWMGGLFIVLSFVCQHRSVWAALGVAVMVISLRLRGVALARVVVSSFYAAAIGLGLWASGAFDNVIATLELSATSSGTYDARVDTWQQLVDDSVERGVGSVVFGEPFGFGYDRYDKGRLLTFAPHNWYVSVYLRLGLIGIALYLVLLAIILVKLVRSEQLVSVLVFVAVIVYSWSYSLSWYLAPALGFAMAMAMGIRRMGPVPPPDCPNLPSVRITHLM